MTGINIENDIKKIKQEKFLLIIELNQWDYTAKNSWSRSLCTSEGFKESFPVDEEPRITGQSNGSAGTIP